MTDHEQTIKSLLNDQNSVYEMFKKRAKVETKIISSHVIPPKIEPEVEKEKEPDEKRKICVNISGLPIKPTALVNPIPTKGNEFK